MRCSENFDTLTGTRTADSAISLTLNESTLTRRDDIRRAKELRGGGVVPNGLLALSLGGESSARRKGAGGVC